MIVFQIVEKRANEIVPIGLTSRELPTGKAPNVRVPEHVPSGRVQLLEDRSRIVPRTNNGKVSRFFVALEYAPPCRLKSRLSRRVTPVP